MNKQLHSENYALFLKLLREARERRGISQGQLAERLRVLQSYVSKCETGARRMDAVELLNWLNALRAHPEVFIRELTERLENHRSTLRFLSPQSEAEPPTRVRKLRKPADPDEP